MQVFDEWTQRLRFAKMLAGRLNITTTLQND